VKDRAGLQGRSLLGFATLPLHKVQFLRWHLKLSRFEPFILLLPNPNELPPADTQVAAVLYNFCANAMRSECQLDEVSDAKALLRSSAMGLRMFHR
jgi:hypothetical protein